MKKIILGFVQVTLVLTLFVQGPVALAQEDQTDSGTTAPAQEFPPPLSTQQPAIRPRPPQDPNPESSSFFGEPENLDPLRARQETIRDDDEPVLEDIRSVLEAPKPKKVTSKKSTAKTSSKKSKKSKKTVRQNLNPDDPDLSLEKRLYQDFMKYASEPTSQEGWSAAVAGREAEIYVVQKGDTLWTISETLFGDSLFWPKIWAINRQGILNPHFILPGMNVRFYPGSTEDEPTLAVGEDAAADGSSNDVSDYDVEDDQQDASVTNDQEEVDEPALVATDDSGPVGANVARKSARRSGGRAAKLPPSLPVYRSDLYFNKPRSIEVQDMPLPPVFKTPVRAEYIVTDRLVVSDVKFLPQAVFKLNCNPGEMLQDFQFVRNQNTLEYEGLELVKDVPFQKKTFYVYKRMARFIRSEGEQMRIFDCRSPLTADTMIVPAQVVPKLKTRDNNTVAPSVLASIETTYSVGTRFPILVNLGGRPVQAGQSVIINSNRFNVPSASVEIVDVYGSLAVGVVRQMDHSIEVGDRIIVK